MSEDMNEGGASEAETKKRLLPTGNTQVSGKDERKVKDMEGRSDQIHNFDVIEDQICTTDLNDLSSFFIPRQEFIQAISLCTMNCSLSCIMLHRPTVFYGFFSS